MNKTPFDKIAGYSEEKNELNELCNLINHREELKALKAKTPSGVLLMGMNGLGKTVLAKSFIEASNCNCVSIEIDEVENKDEMDSYMKEKFEEAKNSVPCILYIDELDKLVGNAPGPMMMQDNFANFRYLLSLLNKYKNVDGIFYLFTANTNYYIDKSITRSGRVDRKIVLSLPNVEERYSIIDYYTKDKGFAGDIDKNNLAKMSAGFSGADIETWLNNAIVKAFSKGQDKVTSDILLSCFNDQVFKATGKTVKYNKRSERILSYHEAGHACLNYLLLNNSLNTISIVGRGSARGFVSYSNDEKDIADSEHLLNQISCDLGGLAAEKLFCNVSTQGSASDLESARKMACNLVRYSGLCGFKYMMPIDSEDDDSCMSGAAFSSQSRLEMMEQEEDKLLSNCLNKANQLLKGNEDFVKKVAETLMIQKTITNKDMSDIYKSLRS